MAFPPVCSFCRSSGPFSTFPNICRSCLSRLPLRFGSERILDLPAFRWSGRGKHVPIFCAAYYQSPVKQALLALTLGQAPELSPALAGLLHLLVSSTPIAADAILALPLHPDRQAARGYNQSGLLASLLARWLALPDCSAGLVRTRASCRQHETKSRAERLANPQGAFELVPAFWDNTFTYTRNMRLLLVDDRLTTGATLTAAACPLLSAGFSVTGLVVASDAPGRQDQGNGSHAGDSRRW